MDTMLKRYGKVFHMADAWYVELIDTSGHVTLRGAIEEARKAGDIETAFELTSRALRAGA